MPMAPSAKHFSLILFLALSLSPQIHARDSQFFSKVTSNNNNVQEVKVENPSKQEPFSNTQEKEQNFVQDSKDGYGLWGHESGQYAPATTGGPSTTTTNYNNEAYVTNPQGMSDPNTISNSNNNAVYKVDSHGISDTRLPGKKYPDNYNSKAYVTHPQGMSETSFAEKEYNNNNNNYYDHEAYVTDSQGMNSVNNNHNDNYYNDIASSGARFEQRGYTTNNYNHGYQPHEVTGPQSMSNGNNYYIGANSYNGQQQGLSDTRFMENGKYYYDLKRENNYPSGYHHSSNRDYNHENGVKRYNTQLHGLSGSSPMNTRYSTQQQGMSDTRFLANGKYFYDLKSENNYGHGYGNPRGINYNRGYNGNSYESNNFMGNYQNQEEFEENQEEEYVP